MFKKTIGKKVACELRKAKGMEDGDEGEQVNMRDGERREKPVLLLIIGEKDGNFVRET